MKTLVTIVITLAVVMIGIAIFWLHIKTVADDSIAEKRAAEQRIRDKYGDEVIID